MSVAIRLDDVTKRFGRQRQLSVGMKELLLHPRRSRRIVRAPDFVAIDGLRLDIRKGETFGVVGRNGAGKSTLLALICGVLRPTSGRLEVHGRVAPLLELGVGFVAELGARDNAELSGVMMGLLRREVRERMDSILAFAGLEHAADQPLRTFSSGMLARLGFAMAVHTDPDVLLVDEVLSVGDAEFQERCLRRVAELHREGVTIVFVSHDLEVVTAICDRVAWLEEGHLAALGPAQEVVDRYLEKVGEPPPPRRRARAR